MFRWEAVGESRPFSLLTHNPAPRPTANPRGGMTEPNFNKDSHD
jgi:hypothetical protein